MIKVFFSLCMAVFLSGCNDSGSNPPAEEPVEGVMITSPKAGATYEVGDQIAIVVRTDNTTDYSFLFSLSVDGGQHWTLLNTAEEGQVDIRSDPFVYRFIIPETVVHGDWIDGETVKDTVTTISSQVLVDFKEYNGHCEPGISGLFSIVSR